MDRNPSTTPERERGQHLRFEERCSIKPCRKLSCRTPKELFDGSPDQVYSITNVQVV
jgi:hypothetical protein